MVLWGNNWVPGRTVLPTQDAKAKASCLRLRLHKVGLSTSRSWAARSLSSRGPPWRFCRPCRKVTSPFPRDWQLSLRNSPAPGHLEEKDKAGTSGAFCLSPNQVTSHLSPCYQDHAVSSSRAFHVPRCKPRGPFVYYHLVPELPFF